MNHASTTDRLRLRTAVGLLCALCALSGADAPRSERETLEQARQRIANMSADKRDQLRKSFETFRKLPAERQEQIKLLHADMQADPGLKDVMQKYGEWVVTLDPGPQAELRKELNVNLKIKLVKKYREEQASERSSHDLADMLGPMSRDPRRMIRLDDEQLGEVMAILDRWVRDSLKSEEKSKLASLSGLPRHSQILAYAVDREIDRDHNRPQPMPSFVIDKLNDVLTGKLPPGRKQEIFEKPWLPKMMLWTTVARTLDDQLKSPPPSQSDLEKRFEELTPTERDEIMRLRPDEGQRRLEELFRDSHPELYPLDSARRYSDSMRRLFQPMPRDNRPPAGGPNPAGGPKPEPRPRADGASGPLRRPLGPPRDDKKP